MRNVWIQTTGESKELAGEVEMFNLVSSFSFGLSHSLCFFLLIYHDVASFWDRRDDAVLFQTKELDSSLTSESHRRS